jgi:hypothetical protein
LLIDSDKKKMIDSVSATECTGSATYCTIALECVLPSCNMNATKPAFPAISLTAAEGKQRIWSLCSFPGEVTQQRPFVGSTPKGPKKPDWKARQAAVSIGQTERTKPILAGEARQPMIERAERHELRIPLRFRPEGREDWLPGETINMSESGVLFLSEAMIELDTRLEITFQTAGDPLLHSSTRRAMVVRRTLANWPDTRLAFAVRFRA